MAISDSPRKANPEVEAAPRHIHVLAVDDDPSIRRMIADYLGDNDIRVTGLESGLQIEQAMAGDFVDLLLLDLKLPGEDGMKIAQNIRAKSDIPIIMLTGRKDEADRVMGLELGADDYLVKPFSPRELLARIRALLRRSRTHETVADGLARIRAYRFAGWELSVRLRRLTSPHDEVYDRSIDVQVGRLRKKIDADEIGIPLIRTERGAGYVFTAPVEVVR